MRIGLATTFKRVVAAAGERAPSAVPRVAIRRHLVRIVALLTLGSGLLNLYSVTGPSLPARVAALRRYFPFELLLGSRFLTLLTGFALVIASINIWKRKKRAFQVVAVLAGLSIVFHLTKGLDYEEAALSLGLLLALLLTRGQFTVRSSLPEPQWALFRFGLGFAIALVYGVFGFWLLDPRHFGINFTLGDSLFRTLRFLLLAGDPRLVPLTRYGRWFLDSLYLMTVTAFSYGVYSLFRPALYRYNTQPREREAAAEIVERHGRSLLDYHKLWPDKSYFFTPGRECFVSYRVTGSFALALGDPVGPGDSIEPAVRGFRELCEENDWAFAFYQTLPDFLAIYRRCGLKRLKIGDEAIVELSSFTLEGRVRRRMRNKIRQMDAEGFRVRRYEPPISDRTLASMKEVSDDWLAIPGHRERGFTLGTFDFPSLRRTPLFGLENPRGRVLAFVNIVPAHRPGESTADLMRHRHDAPNGAMDYLFVKLFFDSKERGFERFNLGMAPMAGFLDHEQASPAEKAVHVFFQHLDFVFSYRGIREYKGKFASFWEPRYLIYRNPLELPRAAIALARLTASPDYS